MLYGGQTVEQAPVDELFTRPRHPYTDSADGLDAAGVTRRASTLRVIPGAVPRPEQMPAGLPIPPACEYAEPRCADDGGDRDEARRGGTSSGACAPKSSP